MSRRIVVLVAVLLSTAFSLAQSGGGHGSSGGTTQHGNGAPAGTCTNGVLYTDDSSGALYSCNAGTWTAVTGGGTPALSSVINPSANKSFDQTAFTLGFNWSANTGANNLFSVSDFSSNTGTGYLLTVSSGSSSATKPFRVCYRGTSNCVTFDTGTLAAIGTALINSNQLLGATWAAPAAIGTVTPAAITGTVITANTGFVGDVTGNITGNASGSAASLNAAYIDWNSGSGGNSILNKPTLAATTTSTAKNYFTAYNSATGAFTKAQPALADLSDAATIALLAGPTFTGTTTIPALTLSGITGSTQCVHVNTSGVTSGAGADCGNQLGSTAATQVAFGSAPNTLASSANLTYSSSAGLTQAVGANNVDGYYSKRFTDTTPTGNFLHFQNAGATSDLFKVDITGAVTATSYSSSNPSGNAGMISLVQGTAPSNVSNSVNLLAPTSVTTYAITFPAAIAAGIMRLTSGGAMSFAELSGDATTTGSNAVTVVKVNGVAYPTTGASFDAIPILTASNSVSYFQINGGADCGSSTTALKYTQSTHTFGCQTITAAAPGAGGANTQVQFNSSNALAGSANLTWVSPALLVGADGSATGQYQIAGATSGHTTLTSSLAAGGTWTFRNATDSVVGLATTDTLTNKTLTSPVLTTPNLGTPSALTLTSATGLPGAGIVSNSVTATQLAAQYSKGPCTEVWGGSGTSFALTSGDDAVSNNTCYNDSGVTRTITAIKCRSDNASNTTTVNPTFGASGTGTTILSGALTCGSSLAYSSSGTVSNASWTTGTGITPAMGGTLTGTSIAMIVEYTF